jgi:peptide/nickel transport system permease protein
LSRRYGSWLDRIVIALAPTSAAPSWFYGIFLILIFSALLNVMPFGGMTSSPPPADPVGYALSVLRHLVLPVTAIVISAVFLSVYSWRTFFLIFSSEDYVEMAKAKGLSSQTIERRYVLRPTLPNIVTNFALLVITLWSGAIILETVFNWPGLGRLLFRAISVTDVPIIVASTVIYAYLLAITVFLLDFVYALVDPRVKLDAGGAT